MLHLPLGIVGGGQVRVRLPKRKADRSAHVPLWLSFPSWWRSRFHPGWDIRLVKGLGFWATKSRIIGLRFRYWSA